MNLNSMGAFPLLLALAACAPTDGKSAGDQGSSDAGDNPNNAQNAGCSASAATSVKGTKLAAVEEGGQFDSIAIDSSFVYWLDLNTENLSLDLLRIGRTGGNRQSLATFESGVSLVVDASSIYVRTDVGISKVSKDGGSPVPFAAIDHAKRFYLAQDDTRLYAMNEEQFNDDLTCNGQGALFAFNKQTGERTVLADNLKCPSGLAVDSDHVYVVVQQASNREPTLFDRNTALVRVPLAGGTPEVLAQAPLEGGRGIELRGTYVYAVTLDLASFVRIPKAGGAFEKVKLCDGVSFIRTGNDGLYVNTVFASYAFAPFDGSAIRRYDGVQDQSRADFAVDGATIFEVGEKGVWAITRDASAAR